MKYYLISLFLVCSVSLQAEETRTNVLVLDSSNSMQGEVDGKAKMQRLKETLPDIIKQWPSSEKLSVLSYGGEHKKSCSRVRILSEDAMNQKDKLKKRIAKLKAGGHSPLISAMQQAKQQLPKSDRKGNIIIVSDGEDSCRKDANVCRVAKRLKRKHPALVIHTIDMSGKSKNMKCIAKATGGQYQKAQDASQMLSQIFSSETPTKNALSDEEYANKTGKLTLQSIEDTDAKPVPASYIIYSDEGKHIMSFTAEKTVKQELPVGDYMVTSVYNLQTQDVKLRINPDKAINHTFVLGKSGLLEVSAKYRGKPANTLYTIYDESGKELISNTASDTFKQKLPIGSYKVEAKRDGDLKVVKVDIGTGDSKKLSIRF